MQLVPTFPKVIKRTNKFRKMLEMGDRYSATFRRNNRAKASWNQLVHQKTISTVRGFEN
jgi:hypothetical protein